MCDGHAVVCMRDPEIFLDRACRRPREKMGSPLQLRKVGIFYISCLVEGSVPVFLWKPTALVIFEVGRGSAH